MQLPTGGPGIGPPTFGPLVDLGCGRRPVPGAFGLDRQALPGVAVVARLDAAHLPFREASLARVYARHVLEHLEDVPAAMAEIHRVLRPGGECHVEVPYFAAVSAYADPTHRAWFTYTTFEHFGPPATSGWQANRHTWFGSARFGIRRRRLVFGEAHRRLGLQALANRFPALYENLLLYLFPARSLEVVLVRLG
ncbi:MAG TPA: class I SAM-dependent methyltransferase [Chloroflexota bacterium]|nr:class I SAM-dependent methyltransferase [Chloroflexota bacterium]